MYRIPEDLKSKYAFVTLASKRAEQLQRGSTPKVGFASRKVTVIAQHEVAIGAVGPVESEVSGAVSEEE